MAEQTFNEGDIFRWSYKDPGDDRAYGRYHCCSCIAIVRNGRLRDTFWQVGTSFSGGRSFALGDVAELNLVFVANMADLEKSSERNAEYYDDADIVNLNHANSSRDNFYLRKGAKRSAAKMLETARAKMEQAISDAKYAVRRSGEMKELIAKIEAGDTSVYL